MPALVIRDNDGHYYTLKLETAITDGFPADWEPTPDEVVGWFHATPIIDAMEMGPRFRSMELMRIGDEPYDTALAATIMNHRAAYTPVYQPLIDYMPGEFAAFDTFWNRIKPDWS